jgi:hypothetical protein
MSFRDLVQTDPVVKPVFCLIGLDQTAGAWNGHKSSSRAETKGRWSSVFTSFPFVCDTGVLTGVRELSFTHEVVLTVVMTNNDLRIGVRRSVLLLWPQVCVFTEPWVIDKYWWTDKPITVPRGLRHEPSSPALTLGSWARIPLKAWMSVLRAFILYIGRSLTTGWSPVQGGQPIVYRIKKLKKRPRSKGQ